MSLFVSPSLHRNLLQFVFAVFTFAVLSSTLAAQEKPNIVLVNLDDADTNILSDEMLSLRYPNLATLANRGLRFTNLHSTTPLCGPSRACLLRGQYAHNTGILVNEPNAAVANGMPGGIRRYRDQGFFENDLSTWMQDAGYHTMMVGKFLHGDFVNTVPQGWDDFFCFMGSRYFEFYKMTNEERFGKWTVAKPGLYRTNDETQDALNVIQAHADSDSNQPFFLYLNPLAPHNGVNQRMVDVDRYGDLWSDEMAPTDESYDEVDFSDKVADFADLPRIPYGWEVYVNKHYRDRLRATLSFDDQLGAIVDKLEQLNKLDNTYIFVTSDNGFSLGQNRMFGKGYHFDHATRVPLLVAGPGVSTDSKNHLLAHIDLAPTIVDIAGGRIPSLVDGNSFKQLIDDPNSVAERDWQESILIENWETKSIFGNPVLCAANTMRRFDSSYTEHATGDFEYYDLSDDPLQLNNSYSSLSIVGQASLALQLRSLKTDGNPQVGVSLPETNGEIFPGGVELGGIIDAPFGVAAVRLAVFDQASGKFWDGRRWQADFRQVAADVGRTTSMVSTWSYEFRPSNGQLPGGTVMTWAWGYDLMGRYTPPATRSFALETSPPTSTIVSPRHFARVRTVFDIHGTAFSSNQADLVRCVVRRKHDGQYFNGTSFQADWTFMPVPVAADGTWSTAVELEPGEYFVATYAIDQSGVRETKPQLNLFYVD